MSDAGRNEGRKGPEPAPSELAALGRVAGELIHDLAGGLGVLSSRIVLAREDMHLGRASVEDIDRLHRDCERIRTMVSDVLTELRSAARSPEVSFPLAEAVEEGIERWMSSAPRVAVRLFSSLSRESRIAGPRSFLDRALYNLLRNAGRHARGEIRVTLGTEAGSEGRRAVLTVEDDGAGIEPAIAEELFEPLVRGADGQLGLGLSLVHWAVERLGGRVEAGSSDALGGASFRIRLPTTDGRSTAIPPPLGSGTRPPGEPGPRRRSLHRLRVAVVDDEAMLRNLYERLLERSGAEPLAVAPTEFEGELAIASRVVAMDPDAVLLDLDLGMGAGMAVWQHIRDQSPSLAPRVLFLSGAAAAVPLPSEDETPPVVSKLLDWDEIAERIQGAARKAAPNGE